LYVVGAWVALQVVEVLSGVGLPPSTMRNLLMLLSAGFPLALVIGWFFDISKEGVSKTGPLQKGELLPKLKFIDYVLLAGLVVVVFVDAYILTLPPQEDVNVVAMPSTQQRTIAILGFEDTNPDRNSDQVGDVFAAELRSSLARVAGLRVLGPETSKALSLAGEGRLAMAKEMQVSALLLGEVLLNDGTLQIGASLLGVPAGNELWSADFESAVSDAVEIQNGLMRQLIGAIAPGLDPDPVQGARVEAGECTEVYDLYLRGKQLSMARKQSQAVLFNRGMELLRQAVAIDPLCALAWEAIAVASVDWSMPGFVKAGAAARRALELNDTLAGAWSVLAEIAEEERRWSDSEEYFLRALYAEPTNAHANHFYGETLLARGRVVEGLRYALEAYRYDPASIAINNNVGIAALRAGDGDLAIKHARIFADLMGRPEHSWVLGLLAEGYLLIGETDIAVEAITDIGLDAGHWYPQCARVRDDPDLATGVSEAMRETLEEFKAGTLDKGLYYTLGNALLRCGTWLREPDVVFDVLFAQGVPPFEDGVPTEVIFLNMFYPDADVLRQDSRFRELVVESGLLEYWRKWGWSDFCAADGDSFRCD
jgi:TolB-like protein